MIWEKCLVAVVAMGLVCGSALARDKHDEPEKKAALEKLDKAFDAAKKTGKPVALDVGPEDPGMVQKGDLVTVKYTASLQDGSLVYTTAAQVEKDKNRKKSAGFIENGKLGPEAIVAGGGGFVPAVGSIVVGMKPGAKTTETLPPENAFGLRDPKKTAQLPCVKRMPRNPVLDPRTYVGRFGAFPIVGKEVDLVPYFKCRVAEVTEDHVMLEALAKGGEKSEDSFGTTVVKIDGDQIIMTLTPKLGADFEMKDQKGKIASTDGNTFTVDFNPPLAGKDIVLDLEVVSLIKASAFKGMEISWLEDYDEGLAKAKKEGKPTFLLLYAAWCQWSKKTMNESLEDPRIKMLKDQFVWVKVNSEEHKDLYELYEQKGFPLMVLLNPNGDVIKKIDGFREGGALAMDLKAVLGQKVAKKQ